MLAEEVRADAPLAGSSVERARLCRLRRHCEVSQIAQRKVAGPLSVEIERRNALVGFTWFTGRPDQLVSLDQRVTAFRLRPERKADDDKSRAKQQADHHYASVGWFVRVVK